MRTIRYSLGIGFLSLMMTACPGPTQVTGNPDGGSIDVPACENNYCVSTLVTLPNQKPEPSKPIAVAATADDRVGVAYFAQNGTTQYDIRYLEWQAGAVVRDEKVRTVALAYGVALAFASNGQPMVAYLGGSNDANLVYWTENDAEISYRQANGTWAPQIAVRAGNEAVAGNPASDSIGSVVGLFPALGVSGSTTFFAYRDVHFGQGTTDYSKSDTELALGGPTSWTHEVAAVGGDSLKGYGHIQLAMAGAQPALALDSIQIAADGTGQDVYFTKRNNNGTWTSVKTVMNLGSTGIGPSIAYDATMGYGIAAADTSQSALYFAGSTDGNTWSTPFTVHQSGTGGWHPSIAIDPTYHDPSIAYFICSRRTGVAEDSCPPTEVELRISQRAGGVWSTVTVARREAFMPKILFLSTGRRVIVFQSTRTGLLQIAVEQ